MSENLKFNSSFDNFFIDLFQTQSLLIPTLTFHLLAKPCATLDISTSIMFWNF